MKINTLIIDDEFESREILYSMLSEYPEITVVEACPNAYSGLETIERLSPDLLFLDIQMPGMSGIEMLESIPKKDFYTCFYTANEEHAIRAIKQEAFDYLVKPITREELKRCLDRLIPRIQEASNLKTDNNRRFQIKTSNTTYYFKVENVVNVEASGSYAIIHLDDESSILVSKNLKNIEQLLDSKSFIRVHNSQLVHIGKIRSCNYQQGTAFLSNGKEVKLSVRKKEKLKSALELYEDQ